MTTLPLGEVPQDFGVLPEKMLACTIRPDREGDPFGETARAHALMAANQHKGKIGIAIQCAAAVLPRAEEQAA